MSTQPPSPPPPKIFKERPFHNDWFFISSYVLLAVFLAAQFVLIFWMDIF